MSVFKRCKAPGCEKSPDCTVHPWWIQVKARVNGKREREQGPVQKYVKLGLWPADRKVPDTQSEAQKLEAFVLAWVLQGRPRGPQPGGPNGQPQTAADGSTRPQTAAAGDVTVTASGKTLAQALAVYRDTYLPTLACNATPTIISRMEREVGDQPLEAIYDRQLARDFVTKKNGKPLSAGYAAQHFARWRQVMGWLELEFGIRGTSPFADQGQGRKGLKKPKAPHRKVRVPAPIEKQLLAAAARLDDGGMMVGRIICAIDAGLRKGELLSLESTDIIPNYENSGIPALHIRFEVCKTKMERFVPVTTKRLQQFLASRKGKAFVFGQADGARLASFRVDWENILIASGLAAGHWSEGKKTKNGDRYRKWIWTKDANIHWHDLRHECGSRLAERGVPLHDLMVLMGHTSLETTQVYLNSAYHSLAAAMQRAQNVKAPTLTLVKPRKAARGQRKAS